MGAAGFLERLDPGWLEHAYTGGRYPSELAAVTHARRHLPDIALRYRTLLGRLGPALDSPGVLADADAWYSILEGTRERSVAEAQAMALVELVAHAATSSDTEPRAMLLACDDYSAVSGRVPLWSLYERGRSLGIGVQVSAQSWQGLAATEDERYRIAATADGGIWLLRTPGGRLHLGPDRPAPPLTPPAAPPPPEPAVVIPPPIIGMSEPPVTPTTSGWPFPHNTPDRQRTFNRA